jgi:hypothetical protein
MNEEEKNKNKKNENKMNKNKKNENKKNKNKKLNTEAEKFVLNLIKKKENERKKKNQENISNKIKNLSTMLKQLGGSNIEKKELSKSVKKIKRISENILQNNKTFIQNKNKKNNINNKKNNINNKKTKNTALSLFSYNIISPYRKIKFTNIYQVNDILKKEVRNYPSKTCVELKTTINYEFPPNVSIEEIPDYELSGEGGFGKVVKAYWTQPDKNIHRKIVAIKYLLKKEEFDYEMGIVEVLMKYNIPYIIHFIAADSSQQAIVYEWMDINFLHYIEKYNPIPAPYWLLTMYKLLLGIMEIHERDIVHMDIKPENILCNINNPFYIKYADFNLNCYCKTRPCSTKRTTGTSYYINRYQSYDLFKRDIFALGLTLYYIYTGQKITGENRIIMNKMNKDKMKNKRQSSHIIPQFSNVINNKMEREGIITPSFLIIIERQLNSRSESKVGTYLRWMLDPMEEIRPTAKELLLTMMNDYPEIFSKIEDNPNNVNGNHISKK